MPESPKLLWTSSSLSQLRPPSPNGTGTELEAKSVNFQLLRTTLSLCNGRPEKLESLITMPLIVTSRTPLVIKLRMYQSFLTYQTMLVTPQVARTLLLRDMVSPLETSPLALMASTAQLLNSKMIPSPVKLQPNLPFPQPVIILVLTV